MLNENLEVYLPKTVNDTTDNGGLMGSSKVISGVVQNVWPHVPRAERTAGSNKKRKLFCKVSDDADGTLVSPQYWLDDVTPGDDWFVICAGTPTDVQGDLDGTERKYGVAALSSNVTAGTKTIVLQLEDASLGSGNDLIMINGDTIRLTDKSDPTSLTDNEEFLTVDAANLVGTILTVTVLEDIAYDYTVVSGARAMSIYEPADCETSVGTVTNDSAAGTIDDTLIDLDNIGTIDQSMTLTFTDAINFGAVSNVSGVTLASGNINADYSPENPDFSKPYGTIPLLAWGGTFSAGDIVVVPTASASFSVWEIRTVPANAASQANNKITLVTAGEAS
jgi:hypothetical protein